MKNRIHRALVQVNAVFVKKGEHFNMADVEDRIGDWEECSRSITTDDHVPGVNEILVNVVDNDKKYMIDSSNMFDLIATEDFVALDFIAIGDDWICGESNAFDHETAMVGIVDLLTPADRIEIERMAFELYKKSLSSHEIKQQELNIEAILQTNYSKQAEDDHGEINFILLFTFEYIAGYDWESGITEYDVEYGFEHVTTAEIAEMIDKRSNT